MSAPNVAGVAYVIIGIAVAAHGAVRATADLDIVPEATAENLERLARVLSDLGAGHPVDGVLSGTSSNQA